MSVQADFAAALSAPAGACPASLRTWNGSDPARRFGIHRNNVIVSRVEALADSFPVVQSLVGADFFQAMAGEFVLLSPPRSPVLAEYGADFAEFVAAFPPVAALPYLADLARLEWMRVEALHAADAAPLPPAELATLLARAERLPGTLFVLHPALRTLRSIHPVVSLWAAHQTDDPAAALQRIDLACGEAAVLVRPALAVDVIPVEPGAAAFIARLQAGLPLGAAIDAEAFDLPAALALLIRHDALSGIRAAEDGR
jgi:hypothetical protein